jgi:hypothetical protein
MKLQIASVCSLALVVVACSKNDSGGAATTGAFLKPSDFSNLSYDQLSGTEAVEQLKDSNEIYDNAPASGSTPAGDDDSSGDPAMVTCMKNNQPKVNIIEKSTINVDANIDILQCLKAQSGASSPSFEGGQFTLRYVFNISCPGADFSELQGKKFDEIGLSDEDPLSATVEAKCKDAESIKTFANAYMVIKSGGSAQQAFEVSMKMGHFGKDGTACTSTKTTGGYLSNGCLQMTYDTSAIGGQTQKKLSVFESSSLINTLGTTDTWFAGGSYKVALNNFTGTLTYTGGTTAPSYSLAGGGETLTGSLSNPTLALESFRRPQDGRAIFSGSWAQLTNQVEKAWNSVR